MNERKPGLLIVDDSLINRTLLQGIFDRDYCVHTAENGVRALETLRRNTACDCVILDLQMPEMDGFEVLGQMAADPALRAIPVVVITASEDPDSQIRSLDLGALDVLNKPFDPTIVRHRIDNIIARREAEKMAAETRLYTELLRQSELDDRTGLYNKKGFFRHAAEQIARDPEGEYLIVRFDIDKFKVYNEVFGTAAGDELLTRLGATVGRDPAPDSVFGRLEADHFAGLLPRRLFDEERWCAAQSEYLLEHSRGIHLSSSVGVYEITDRSVDISLMCDRALLALRTVKDSYTTKVAWYSERMRREMLDMQALERDMETALQEEQFILYFQPQINYEDGTLIGAEALVRWQHPERGLVSPGVFIPLFEKNGFISRLDEYVWRKSARYMRDWMDRCRPPFPLSVSVNISRLDIYDPQMCANLAALVKEYNIPPELFRLEITESAYMDNPEQLIEVVKTLQTLGFKVEMDDFGSGYSSLNTLKDVPVDILKLDTRFLATGGDDVRGGNILTSIIRMAHWLKLPVIAEGVETREQADYLKSLNCFFMQGFYFSRPLPPEEFEKLLENSRIVTEDRYEGASLQGMAAFWDPSAQNTLLFNSFVGGAAILEYQRGAVELLRSNDNYYETLCTTRTLHAERGTDLMAGFSPEDRATYLRALEEAIRTGRESVCEVRNPPGIDGSPCWTRNRARVLARNVDSYLIYLSIENITERKLVEDELRISQEALRLTISGMGKLICNYDVRAQVLTLPQEYARKHGIPTRLEGIPDRFEPVRLVQEDRARYLDFYREVSTGRRDCEVTVRMRGDDDTYCWERYTAVPLFDQAGQCVRAVVSVEDVTRQREQDVENERNRLLIERTGICVFDYDVIDDTLHLQASMADKGVVTRKIPQFSKQADRNPRIAPGGADIIHDCIRASVAGPMSSSCDFVADAWGTGLRWCRAHLVSMVDQDGQVYRIVGQIDDIQSEKDQDALIAEMSVKLGGKGMVGAYSGALLEQALSLLYETTDAEDSVRKLLAIIGNYYSVSRAYIFEDSADHAFCSNTFEWCAPGVTPEIENLQRLSYRDELLGYSGNFDSVGVFYCPDISILPPGQRSVLEPQGIKAMLQCALLDDGVFSGYIGFDDCDGNRIWTAEQVTTLTLVAKLLGSFLLKGRKTREALFSADFRAALDDNSAFIYVIDPATHEIKYNNKAIRTHSGRSMEGCVCYRDFMGRSAPCENCPVTAGRPLVLRRPDGMKVLAQAYALQWKGRAMYALTSTDISGLFRSMEKK